MVLCAICSCGTRCGRDKGINMARIPSIIHYYSTRRSTETFHDRVCSKHFISGKAVKLWDRYDPDLVPTQNLGHQKCRDLLQITLSDFYIQFFNVIKQWNLNDMVWIRRRNGNFFGRRHSFNFFRISEQQIWTVFAYSND